MSDLRQNILKALECDASCGHSMESADACFVHQVDRVVGIIDKEINSTTDAVTRFEVIDHTKDGEGRVLVKHNIKAELSYQDNGRTLKVFLTDREPS